LFHVRSEYDAQITELKDKNLKLSQMIKESNLQFEKLDNNHMNQLNHLNNENPNKSGLDVCAQCLKLKEELKNLQTKFSSLQE